MQKLEAGRPKEFKQLTKQQCQDLISVLQGILNEVETQSKAHLERDHVKRKCLHELVNVIKSDKDLRDIVMLVHVDDKSDINDPDCLRKAQEMLSKFMRWLNCQFNKILNELRLYYYFWN